MIVFSFSFDYLNIATLFLVVFILYWSSLGKSIQAAESALTLEKHRLKKLEELEAVNQSLKSCSNEVSIFFLMLLSIISYTFSHKSFFFSFPFITICRTLASLKKQIARAIKQIRATKDNVRYGSWFLHDCCCICDSFRVLM